MTESASDIKTLSRRERLEIYNRKLFAIIESIRDASNIKDINTTVGRANEIVKLVQRDYPELAEKALNLITKFWRRDAARSDVVNCLEMMRRHVCQDLEKERKNDENIIIVRKLLLELAYHPEKVVEILPDDFFDKLKGKK